MLLVATLFFSVMRCCCNHALAFSTHLLFNFDFVLETEKRYKREINVKEKNPGHSSKLVFFFRLNDRKETSLIGGLKLFATLGSFSNDCLATFVDFPGGRIGVIEAFVGS